MPRNPDYNDILGGQISSVKGSTFEEDCTRFFIKNATFTSKIIRHLVMDFAVLDGNLEVFDAKTTPNITTALREGAVSLGKINTKNININVISPYSDSRVITHDEYSRDKNFKNTSLGIRTKDVPEIKSYINNYFNHSKYLEFIKKEFGKFSDINNNLDSLIEGKPNGIEKYFLSISDVKNKIFSRRAILQRKIKIKIEAGSFTNDDFFREYLKEYWDEMEKKWK